MWLLITPVLHPLHLSRDMPLGDKKYEIITIYNTGPLTRRWLYNFSLAYQKGMILQNNYKNKL